MVNRLRGRTRGKQNKKHFMQLGVEGTNEIVLASRSGQKWKPWEDAVIIAAGTSDSVELDAALAAQLGRTPGAVRARRQKLKDMGKL